MSPAPLQPLAFILHPFPQPLQSETAAELEALLPSILDQAFKGEL